MFDKPATGCACAGRTFGQSRLHGAGVIGVGHKTRVLLVAEQVMNHITNCGFAGLQPHKLHQTATACVDLGTLDGLPQIVLRTFPFVRRVEPGSFLCLVVVNERERGQLVERNGVGLAQQGEDDATASVGASSATFVAAPTPLSC